eukprot:1145945-Pelagomonas_calceolata.AAC.3
MHATAEAEARCAEASSSKAVKAKIAGLESQLKEAKEQASKASKAKIAGLEAQLAETKDALQEAKDVRRGEAEEAKKALAEAEEQLGAKAGRVTYLEVEVKELREQLKGSQESAALASEMSGLETKLKEAQERAAKAEAGQARSAKAEAALERAEADADRVRKEMYKVKAQAEAKEEQFLQEKEQLESLRAALEAEIASVRAMGTLSQVRPAALLALLITSGRSYVSVSIAVAPLAHHLPAITLSCFPSPPALFHHMLSITICSPSPHALHHHMAHILHASLGPKIPCAPCTLWRTSLTTSPQHLLPSCAACVIPHTVTLNTGSLAACVPSLCFLCGTADAFVNCPLSGQNHALRHQHPEQRGRHSRIIPSLHRQILRLIGRGWPCSSADPPNSWHGQRTPCQWARSGVSCKVMGTFEARGVCKR